MCRRVEKCHRNGYAGERITIHIDQALNPIVGGRESCIWKEAKLEGPMCRAKSHPFPFAFAGPIQARCLSYKAMKRQCYLGVDLRAESGRGRSGFVDWERNGLGALPQSAN